MSGNPWRMRHRLDQLMGVIKPADLDTDELAALVAVFEDVAQRIESAKVTRLRLV
ncbi:hypothetical protein [Mycolicibacillus trivialis]|uniref:hypothetical protein n=1 Tax=Mycolicibacillus trivialis TaxID=1798 RepID=UPI0013FE1D35|nr:hypothetical protein [Mycolicibacillus trivialis]